MARCAYSACRLASLLLLLGSCSGVCPRPERSDDGFDWETTPTTGEIKVLILRVTFKDSNKDHDDWDNKVTSPAEYREAFGKGGHLDRHYQAASHGKVWFADEPVVTDVIKMDMNVPSDKCKYKGNVLNRAMQKVQINREDFGAWVLHVPDSEAHDSAFVGRRGLVLSGKTFSAGYMFVVGHEFGHNFGFNHAGLYEKVNPNGSGMGPHVEYGNPMDVMGPQYAMSANPVPDSGTKYKTGWIDSCDVISPGRAVGTAEYKLYEHDRKESRGHRGIMLGWKQHFEETNYWLDYRGNQGWCERFPCGDDAYTPLETSDPRFKRPLKAGVSLLVREFDSRGSLTTSIVSMSGGMLGSERVADTAPSAVIEVGQKYTILQDRAQGKPAYATISVKDSGEDGKGKFVTVGVEYHHGNVCPFTHLKADSCTEECSSDSVSSSEKPAIYGWDAGVEYASLVEVPATGYDGLVKVNFQGRGVSALTVTIYEVKRAGGDVNVGEKHVQHRFSAGDFEDISGGTSIDVSGSMKERLEGGAWFVGVSVEGGGASRGLTESPGHSFSRRTPSASWEALQGQKNKVFGVTLVGRCKQDLTVKKLTIKQQPKSSGAAGDVFQVTVAASDQDGNSVPFGREEIQVLVTGKKDTTVRALAEHEYATCLTLEIPIANAGTWTLKVEKTADPSVSVETIPVLVSGATGPAPVPVPLTCEDDDSLRVGGAFDGWDTGSVQNIPLGTMGTWKAVLKELPGGSGDNAAVVGAELSLHQPSGPDAGGVGVTVLYFKALADDSSDASIADVRLIGKVGAKDVECARIQGDVLGSERSWTASGTSSTTLLHKLQPTGPRNQYTRVELRSSWDAGQGAEWSLFLIAEGGKNKNRIIKPTGIAKACPNGVSKIEFLGTNVLYDDVQLTCSTKYPVAAPASGWGDPHFRNSFGGSFDFMGVPNKPYVLFDNGLVMVTALVERCNPGNPSVTCFSEVRASAYNHWPEEVVAKATKPGQPSKVQVAKLDFCSEVQRTFSWVDAVDGAPGGAAVLKVLGDDGEAELVHFTLTAYGFHGGRYISVNAKPQPALHFLGLRGLMFNSGKVWNELEERAKLTPGKPVTFDESLVTVPWYAACMCESTENIEKGYCEDFQKRGAEVLQQEAVLVVQRAEDAEKRCGPDALSNARRCCRDLSGIPEYEAEYAQCVLDECEKPSGPSADCLESTTKALRFVDATGPVPLKLCPGNGNVVPDLVTGSCAPETGACREGWYPAGVCTARCVPEETCGGAPCSENGLCVCPDGKERHGVCPSEPKYDVGCTSDDDCRGSRWCRPITIRAGACGAGLGKCVPFAGLGEKCSDIGWLGCSDERCGPDLLCTAIKKDGPKHCLPECGYLGCFHNSATWMRPAMSHPDMTHEMCRARCAESNMYGLSGTECFCGFRSHLEFPEIAHADEGECSSLCPGDPESNCGGEKAIGFYTHTCKEMVPM